jgi:hypothetical protein
MTSQQPEAPAIPDQPVIDMGFLSLPAEVQQAAEGAAAANRVQRDTAAAKTLITGALLAELGRRLYEYENTITWNTSCTSCARTLDSAYAETVRREQAEAKLAAIGTALREHYLAGITCDRAREEDNPVCACSRVFLGWHPSVGEAVEAWIGHVMEVVSDEGETPRA